MATEETRLERALMLLALLSCDSGSSTSGSASAKFLSALFGLPCTLASLGLVPDSLPADCRCSSENCAEDECHSNLGACCLTCIVTCAA